MPLISAAKLRILFRANKQIPLASIANQPLQGLQRLVGSTNWDVHKDQNG